jgi:hypothetical protein
MEYGILVVEADVEGIGVWDHYQIIGPVDSIDEAREIAQNYLVNGPESGCLAPDRFVIHRRGPWGWYTIREVVNL